MTPSHPSELDSATTDSVASSPRSDRLHDDLQARVRFMCSFGGKILPRPHDNQLRYVGGDTRIVAMHRHTTFAALLAKLAKLAGSGDVTIKYQLPNEDLDALISVSTDEDIDNMMEEYDRLVQAGLGSKTVRLRLFLFPTGDDSRTSSISSLLDGSTRRENWFFEALNGGGAPGLERGRSEVSSIVSEVPDYLFGLDNSDDPREPKLKSRHVLQDNVSASDPGSPAPRVSSPFCSTSFSQCVPSMPDLPPVKTKPDNPIYTIGRKESQLEGIEETREHLVSQPTGYTSNPMWQYTPEAHLYSPDAHLSGPAVQPIPVYYVPGPVPPSNVPVQPIQIRSPYVQQYSAPAGQVPVGFHHQVMGMSQVYGGGMRPAAPMESYEMPAARVMSDGVNQQLYYGRGPGMVQMYPGMVPAGEEMQVSGSEANMGRVSHSSGP